LREGEVVIVLFVLRNCLTLTELNNFFEEEDNCLEVKKTEVARMIVVRRKRKGDFIFIH